MNPGTLDQRITLQQRSATVDGWGQPVEEWADVATVWANVRFMSGSELIKSGIQQQATQASIRIRARAVDPSMRVLHKGVTYNITAVLPGQRNEHVDLTVTAVGV